MTLQGEPKDALIDYYQEADEDSRLSTGSFQLEFARTQNIVSRCLKPAPGVIIDAGGGSGIYACWLAALGYEVHLSDPIGKHIEQARNRSEKQERPIASMKLGDARKLDHLDSFADAVLLLGPLYHVTERKDRIACLREAHRVMKSGAIVFAASISHFAALFDSLHGGFFDDPQFAEILARDLKDGQHRNPTENPIYFTTAFFHRPRELAEEIREAGFQLQQLVSIEGPGWLARDFDRLWSDDKQRARLLDCVRQVEHEPAILGCSAHFMGIGKKN